MNADKFREFLEARVKVDAFALSMAIAPVLLLLPSLKWLAAHDALAVRLLATLILIAGLISVVFLALRVIVIKEMIANDAAFEFEGEKARREAVHADYLSHFVKPERSAIFSAVNFLVFIEYLLAFLLTLFVVWAL